ERGMGRAVEAALVLLLFDRENVAGALGAGKQVLAVITLEEFSERLDTSDNHQQVVLVAEREHGIDKIVPCPLIAELNLQAVGQEGEQIGGKLCSIGGYLIG